MKSPRSTPQVKAPPGQQLLRLELPFLEAVMEGGACDISPEDLPGQLKELPTAGVLAQHAADAQANEPKVIQRTIAMNATVVVAQEVNGRGEDLIQQPGMGMEFETPPRSTRLV